LRLRNIFTMSAMKNYFFETCQAWRTLWAWVPEAYPLAEKVQNLLIADFLNYLASEASCLPVSTMSALEKKKLKTEP
jgi:hypothetical protein